MSRQSIQPEKLFDSSAYGFAQVVACSGQRLVYCAGQTASDKDLNFLGAGDLKPRDVVSIRTYIVDYTPEYLEIISPIMNEFFADNLPASTLIGVKALALPHFMCEIEATAVLE